MSYRRWYSRSWEEHYKHQGWSALCDDEVEDEAPAPPRRYPREPYFEEWEEMLNKPLPVAPAALKSFKRRARRSRKEGEEEDEEEEEEDYEAGGELL